MEKIKLNDKQILEIIPMGIDTKIYEKKRVFSFISGLDYIDLIEYFSSTDELLKTYDDCVGLKMLSKEFNKEYLDGKFADVYTVILNLS